MLFCIMHHNFYLILKKLILNKKKVNVQLHHFQNHYTLILYMKYINTPKLKNLLKYIHNYFISLMTF